MLPLPLPTLALLAAVVLSLGLAVVGVVRVGQAVRSAWRLEREGTRRHQTIAGCRSLATTRR